MAEKPVVLVTERIADVGIQLLDQSCSVKAPWRDGRTATNDDLGAADAIITRLFKVTEAVLAAAPKLRVIGRHGIGLDSVDLPAATKRGIPVVFTPSAQTMLNAVAEHTVHLMLALARHTVAADRLVREGTFDHRGSLQGFELCGRTLGVVGLGAIGKRVGDICQAGFRMRVIAYDPYTPPTAAPTTVTMLGSLRELLEQSDVVVLHLPSTPETLHLINTETLRFMKPSAMLINTARGSVVDSVALAEALRQGHLWGAAMDVFEKEPLPLDHPLMSAPRTLFSPHIASSTGTSLERMAELVARQVIQVLQGERPEHVGNPAVYNQGGSTY